MKIGKTIKKVFGKSFCSICFSEGKLRRLDKLELCEDCFNKVKEMESEEPFKISKENIAGGIKDEL